jgi:hypothetical protein
MRAWPGENARPSTKINDIPFNPPLFHPNGYVEKDRPSNISPKCCNFCSDMSERIRKLENRDDEAEKHNHVLRDQLAKAKGQLNELRRFYPKPLTESHFLAAGNLNYPADQ